MSSIAKSMSSSGRRMLHKFCTEAASGKRSRRSPKATAMRAKRARAHHSCQKFARIRRISARPCKSLAGMHICAYSVESVANMKARSDMRKGYDFSVGRRGAVVAAAPGKTRITIRLDDDLLSWFRQKVDESGGGSYQTMINDALRKFVEGQQEPLETVLRRVVKEELQKDRAAGRRRAGKAA